MAGVNIKNKIRQRIKEYDSTIDTRPGSVVSDILIEPLSILLEDYESASDSIAEQVTFTNLSDIPAANLDAIGLRYLLTRRQGSYAIGEIYFYFKEPKSAVVSKGTIINSNGLSYRVVRDFSITKVQMQSDLSDYPYYKMGPIEIISVEPGINYNLPVNSNFTIEDSLRISPAKIVNTEPFVAGEDSESNEQFFNRIIDAVHANSLASPKGIISLIKNYSPLIYDIEVVGANNPLMYRDIIYNVSDLNGVYNEDFEYVYSGQHDGFFDKEHIAYAGIFHDASVINGSEVDFPDPGAWTDEFTNEQYKGLYKLQDLFYAETSNTVLIRDFTNNQFDLPYLLTSGNWNVHDGFNTNGALFYSDEVRMEGKSVLLGKTISQSGSGQSKANNPPVAGVPLVELKANRSLLDALAAGDPIAEQKLQNVMDFFDKYSNPENFNNLAPVLHKPISQHVGINVKAKFSTTDATEEGQVSYITALRNDRIFVPHDGYGFAWRKQPGFLIRMNNNNYTGAEGIRQKLADKTRFIEEYASDEATFNSLLGTISDPSNSRYWKYNIYLVDNDVLEEEVWAGYDQIWHQASGRNQFLVAGKSWIEPEITYNVEFTIYEYLGFDCYVWEDGGTKPANTTITRGQTYPPTVPVSGNKVIAGDGTLKVEAYRNHFGIGVAETHNYEWTYSDLEVASIIESFGMHLFKFKVDTSAVDIYQGLNIKYYGMGFDDQYWHSQTPSGKVKLGVYNPNTTLWEDLGYHYNTVPSSSPLDLDDILISGMVYPLNDYLDGDYIYLAAAAANLEDGTNFINNTKHTLRTYYINIDTQDVQGIHRGNATDVYCNDPRYISNGSVVTTLVGNTINTGTLIGIDPYIQEITAIREHISGQLIPVTEYLISSTARGLEYSDSANYEIVFSSAGLAGALIEIEYRYWKRGAIIETMLNASDMRYPCADTIAKVMPPTVVNITKLEYSGGLEERDMRLKIMDYFYTLENIKFDKSDLIQLLYSNGATYVSLDVDITIREYDILGDVTITEMNEQSYTISGNNISRFYTNLEELTGVRKV